LNLIPLLVDEQFRVSDDVDKQDVPDFEFHIRGSLGRHQSSFYLKTCDATSDLVKTLDSIQSFLQSSTS